MKNALDRENDPGDCLGRVGHERNVLAEEQGPVAASDVAKCENVEVQGGLHPGAPLPLVYMESSGMTRIVSTMKMTISARSMSADSDGEAENWVSGVVRAGRARRRRQDSALTKIGVTRRQAL